MIIPRAGWREKSKVAERIETFKLYSMFDQTDPNSFLNQMSGPSSTQTAPRQQGPPGQSPGGSFFDTMSG